MGQKTLIISGENVSSAVPPQAGAVLVTWDTNIPATSQVVYGLTSGGPYSLNLTLTNFGYPFGTIEDATKTVSHSVKLEGLVPNQFYSYRVVSRASPPTVSNEHTFMLNEDGTINTNSPLVIASQENGQNNSSQPQLGAGEVLGASTFRAGGASATTSTTTASTTSVGNNGLAAAALLAGFSFGSMQNILLIILMLVLIGGGFWFWDRSKRD
jgi:hypothetical protein